MTLASAGHHHTPSAHLNPTAAPDSHTNLPEKDSESQLADAANMVSSNLKNLLALNAMYKSKADSAETAAATVAASTPIKGGRKSGKGNVFEEYKASQLQSTEQLLRNFMAKQRIGERYLRVMMADHRTHLFASPTRCLLFSSFLFFSDEYS
jgi:hypothetical protein